MILGPWPPTARSRSARWATTPPWPYSPKPPAFLFAYFKQLFAQVTNPPIDPLREELVMSLMSFVGREQNLLDETPQHAGGSSCSIRSSRPRTWTASGRRAIRT